MDRLTRKRLKIFVDAALATLLFAVFLWALSSCAEKEAHRVAVACIKDNGKESDKCRGEDAQ